VRAHPVVLCMRLREREREWMQRFMARLTESENGCKVLWLARQIVRMIGRNGRERGGRCGQGREKG